LARRRFSFSRGLDEYAEGLRNAALVAWVAEGWHSWLIAAAAATVVYPATNGFEYAIAGEGDSER
jgi:hypothetical protein